MRVKAGIFIIISLLFLVGTVAAIKVDTVNITSDKSYITANGVDQSTITVIIRNTSYNSGVQNANVNFSVNDPTLGTLNTVNYTTGTDGKATSIFTAKTKSGFANITVGVFYSDADGIYSKLFIITQKIDHGNAHTATFSHLIQGNVSENILFNISFTDYYGNPIDQIINLGQQHTINLHVHGPTPDDCGFFINGVGYGHDLLNLPLDKNGNVNVTVQLSSGTGPNSVTMDPYEDIVNPVPRIITGISTLPFFIDQNFNPDLPAQIPADGLSKFSILYTLYDKFHNPASQQSVWVNTSAGEKTQFQSDALGHISLTYGSFTPSNNITITATAVNNKTVTISHNVTFLSTAATTMVVTANPEVMVSRDKNPSITSDITATVTDISGDPKAGEIVTFSLGNEGYPGGPYNVTSPSSLNSTSAITDVNGHATVQFIPGAFSTNSSDLYYNPTATGNRIITAHWNTTDKDILITWKNYPYLSVLTSVNPQTVGINNTVDITILLKGDGWAIQHNPIDALLCTDRSGSMLYDDPDRMYSIREAGKVFVDQMNVSRDYVGLLTFGRSGYISRPGYNSGISQSEIDNTYNYPVTYSDYATFDRNLSNGFTAVKTALDNIVPDYATPMRSAIYKSVREMIDLGRPGSVKAIILLTDGDYNYYGDPLARGTSGSNDPTSYNDLTSSYYTFSDLNTAEQNMSVYAKDHGIRIYSIAFADQVSSGGKTTLSVLANATGGIYYEATATNIADVYKAIAADLGNTAGVNTTMTTDFTNVSVTNVSVPGAQVYDYVYNVPASTNITWQNGTRTVIDQSADWADHMLSFTIGTIKVGQTWQATFRLKVKKSGSIDIFGANSALYFNNGTETLNLPHTFLNVMPDLNTTGLAPQTITVISSCPVMAQQMNILPITWTTNYTGPANTISDEVLYISESGAHVPFFQGSYTVPGDDIRSRSAQFDMRTVPPGNYAIQVVTNAGTSTSASQSCGNYTYSTKGVTFIQLN